MQPITLLSAKTRELAQALFKQILERGKRGEHTEDAISLTGSQASALRRDVEIATQSRLDSDCNASTIAEDMERDVEEPPEPPDWDPLDAP